MKRDFSLFLKDIVENIDHANAFVGAMTYVEFVNDRKAVWTVSHALEIIGEAVKNLPAKIRKRYPEVPWDDMAGLRDKIAHSYFGIDYQVI